MSDRIISLIRTLVPKAWGLAMGALLAWLATHAPWAISALDELGIDLGGAAAVVLVVTATETVWYALWRWLEPRIPDWLTRLVLGSAKAPSYAPVSADGVATITSMAATPLPPLPLVDQPTMDLARVIDAAFTPDGRGITLAQGSPIELAIAVRDAGYARADDDPPKHAA